MNTEKFWAAVKAVLSQKDEIKAIAEKTSVTLGQLFALFQSVVTAYATLASDAKGRGAFNETTVDILEAYAMEEADAAL